MVCGDIMTMPGLQVPATERIDIDDNGNIIGLFKLYKLHLDHHLSEYISLWRLKFIGSRFIRRWNNHSSSAIINIDKLTYADQSRLNFMDENYFYADINNKNNIREIINKHKPNLFINFAAETHVDNRIFI